MLPSLLAVTTAVRVPAGTEHGSGLGTRPWAVERAFARLHWFRSLRVRWEMRDDIHEAVFALGCTLIYWRYLSLLTRAPALPQ
ncbi:hypothetical protein [Streptomyces pilosus]|uniref:hypothetical protein n=1 Tax=Streptomyces pilosus TaxID=28893 RepID=UPI00362E1E06